MALPVTLSLASTRGISFPMYITCSFPTGIVSLHYYRIGSRFPEQVFLSEHSLFHVSSSPSPRPETKKGAEHKLDSFSCVIFAIMRWPSIRRPKRPYDRPHGLRSEDPLRLRSVRSG